jgi:casein kinase 1
LVDNKKHLLYVIDFGLSKKFRHSKTGIHIEYRDGKELTGTARYASISTHLGIEQSRRDDLESVGYIMVYFLKGSLPWQGLKAKTTYEKYEMIKNVKVNTTLNTLCKDLPPEIANIINYTRGLAFDETPDYNKIKLVIKRLIEANEFKIDFLYDWVLKTNKEKKDKENKNEDKDKDINIIQDDKDDNIIQNNKNNNNNNNVIGEEPYI